MKKQLRTKIAGNRLRWAGHKQEMGEEMLTKRGWYMDTRKTENKIEG